MSPMRKLLFLIFFLLPLSAWPINISVGIYTTEKIKAIIIAPKTGTYLLFGDGKFIDSMTTANVYEIKSVDSSLEIKSLERSLGKYSSIQVKECSVVCSFNIRPLSEKAMRLYNDELTVSAAGGYLKMVNKVEFEHYLAGVVECEGGHKRPLEFYKAQAIICRTYALNNLARHLGDYYELCDAVHCQVYKGTADEADILDAVETTKGLVITDSTRHLIDAAYFSNCGGYTLNSEDVWGKYMPYLRSVKDTFCLNQPHATWVKHIKLLDWNSYMERKEAVLKKDDSHDEGYWDSIPEGRRIYFYDKGYLIPLKDMRLDLNLHSTYFSVEMGADDLILKGRGNGHRIGFCQEGAMNMATLNYTYLQILQFYYHGIQVIDAATLPIEIGGN